MDVILSVALAATMMSCQKYSAKTVELKDTEDSLAYAIGYTNGTQISSYYIQDSVADPKAVDEFIDELKNAWEGKDAEEKSEIAKHGFQFGIAIVDQLEKGLANQPTWPVRADILLQGLVNGLSKEEGVMTVEAAGPFFQAKYQAVAQAQAETDKKVKGAKKGLCPDKPKVITLKDEIDSLNYAFGLLNGNEIAAQLLAEDADGAKKKEFLENVNMGLKNKKHNPQLAQLGEMIGQQIKEQSKTGLIGIEGFETRFEMLCQGFINGFYKYEDMMSTEEANNYIQMTVSELKFGKVRAEGEAFLEANKQRPEVTTTASGLQYEVLTMGKGPRPASDTVTVRVHYEGTLIDGTVFDSSYQRGESISFPLNGVIRGWTEGVQLMSVGSKFKFYIPYQLAYGERGAGQSIPPFAALIFTVELLGIE